MEILGAGMKLPGNQVIEKKDDINNRQAEDEKKLKKACAGFESLFVYQMLKTMRKSIPQSGFLTKGPGRDTYEMMLDQKIADNVAGKQGGFGLQKMLVEQMSHIKRNSEKK
jgi:flagellar protein FlgJ